MRTKQYTQTMMLTERDLSLKQTLQSGQTFRATESDGVWTVFSGTDENVRTLTISQNNLEKAQNNPYWSNYFDLQTDYNAMKERFSKVSPVMERACAYAPGIRILRQDSWEALACFVVSQNNNIKRITGIVDRICKRFGKKNEEGVSGFPCAKTLADAPLDELRDTGLGFRDSYIKNTACAVLDGKIDFAELKKVPVDEARKTLVSVKGIGPKVADCALLFGCHRLDCFPMDVWMKRVMSVFFEGKDGSIFGENAGVAQQYLFHWARTAGEMNNDL